MSFDNSSVRRPVSCFREARQMVRKKETERQIQRENTHHKPQGIVKTVKKRERLRGKALPSLLCTASINNAPGKLTQHLPHSYMSSAPCASTVAPALKKKKKKPPGRSTLPSLSYEKENKRENKSNCSSPTGSNYI